MSAPQFLRGVMSCESEGNRNCVHTSSYTLIQHFRNIALQKFLDDLLITVLTSFLFLFQVVELNLDNCRATQVEGLTEAYTALETLSMINVGLVSLKGFPKLEGLKKVQY